MQITSLIQVINYLKTISGDHALLEGYKKLTEMVKETFGNMHGNFEAAILKEKEQLRRVLIESDPSDWGYSSYNLFEKINKNQLFGKAAADYLDNLITPENKDYRAIYSDLNKKLKQISKLSETLNKFWQLFDLVMPDEIFHLTEGIDNRSSFLLYFEGQLSVQNMADLERYARLWDGIMSTLSRLTGEENLSLDISNFRDGCIVLGVKTDDKTLNAFKTGVNEILTSLSLILKIRKIQVDILLLPLYKDINELLEEEIRILIDQRALESAQKLISLYYNDTLGADDITNDLSRSLKQILSFIEKGGKIEFKHRLSTSEEVKSNKTLIESFEVAHELEKVTYSLVQALEKKEVLLISVNQMDTL
jgi:hypothetical protein